MDFLQKAKEAQAAKDAQVDSSTAKLAEADNGPQATATRLDQNADDSGKHPYSDPARTDASASKLGVEVDEHNDFQKEMAAQVAANAGAAKADGITTYTSHPISNLHLGPYHFENGLLRLESDQVGAFEELLEKLPLTESRHIAKLDLDKVDAIVQQRISSSTQQFDSSVGRAAIEELNKKNPRIGTEALDAPLRPAHAQQSQTDGNVELNPLTLDPLAGEA